MTYIYLMKSQMHSADNLGQYFTTDEGLRSKVNEFVMNNPCIALEPSVGQGHLALSLSNKHSNCHIDMFEIDTSIKLMEGIKGNLTHADFLSINISRRYPTIIGNPPFVRTTQGNLYIDFIRKSLGLLEDKGEMVFIVPSDFFKLTSASSLLTDMMSQGTFTHIYLPNNEKLFANASIDVVVFRYCRDISLPKVANLDGREVVVREHKGLVTFEDKLSGPTETLGDWFHVYVGLVTGKESVFKNELYGNVNLLTGSGKREKYIMLDDPPDSGSEVGQYMIANKQNLLDRKIRIFNESNWYEWGAPRNIQVMRERAGDSCIYLYNMTRNQCVAFAGEVELFGGTLLMLLPKCKMDIDKVIGYLNSETFKRNFIFSGRFKIGQGQLCKLCIPAEIVLTQS